MTQDAPEVPETLDPDDVERTRFADSALEEVDSLYQEPVDAAAILLVRDGHITVDWHVNLYRQSLCSLALQGAAGVLVRLLQEYATRGDAE